MLPLRFLIIYSERCYRTGYKSIFNSYSRMDVRQPFFFCDSCKMVALFSQRHLDIVNREEASSPSPLSDEDLIGLWERLANESPPCLCGGKFELWANQACPHCGKEYLDWSLRSRRKDLASATRTRLHQEGLSLLHGAWVVDDYGPVLRVNASPGYRSTFTQHVRWWLTDARYRALCRRQRAEKLDRK